jgi:hypothetical protein
MVERAGAERFSFDVGLERISRAETAPTGLPELQSILPSRVGLPDELARVLPDSRLRQMLEAFLTPAAASPELLLPLRFGQVFDGLRRRMERDRRRDPELAAASELLEDERANRELLDYYRTILLGA